MIRERHVHAIFQQITASIIYRQRRFADRVSMYILVA